MEENKEKIKADVLSEKTGRSMKSIKKIFNNVSKKADNSIKKAGLTLSGAVVAMSMNNEDMSKINEANAQKYNRDEAKKEIVIDAPVKAGDEKPTPEKPNVFELAADKEPEVYALPEGVEVEEIDVESIEVEEIKVVEEETFEQLAQGFRETAEDLAEESKDLEETMTGQYEDYISDYDLYKQKEAEGADNETLKDYRHNLVESISGIEMNKIMKNTIESGKHTAAIGEVFSSEMAKIEAGTSDSKSEKQSKKELKKIAKDGEKVKDELLPGNQESIKKVSTLNKESQKDINSDKITKYIDETYKEAKNAVKKDRSNDNEKSVDTSKVLMMKNTKTR